VAVFDRTKWPAPAAAPIGMGIITPMLGIGREKLGQTRSLIASSSDANVYLSHDKGSTGSVGAVVTTVCHLWRGDRSDQRFRRDDHAE
jgi:hypothetical protein